MEDQYPECPIQSDNGVDGFDGLLRLAQAQNEWRGLVIDICAAKKRGDGGSLKELRSRIVGKEWSVQPGRATGENRSEEEKGVQNLGPRSEVGSKGKEGKNEG